MRILKRISLIIVAILAWTAFIVYGGLINGFLLSRLNPNDTPESFIQATVDKIDEEFVGNLGMVLIENGEISKDYFYSIDQQVDKNTVFQVASVSKWVTSWGVFKLVEQGKLDLDTPIDDYLTRWNLPESEFDNRKVTIRRLLSHSSGLVDDLGYDGFGPNETIQTIEQSLTKASDGLYSEGIARVGYDPGERYMYSGAGYTILQLVIEEVSGQSFQDYMTQTVFEPLKMEHSTFVLSDKPNLELAQLYMDDGTISGPSKFTALAAASLYTCTEDLSKFLLANINENKVLTQKSIAQMSESESFINGIGVYGMGPHLYSQNREDSKIIGHDGSSGSPVINTAARIDLKSKNGIIILEMGSHDIASSLADEWIFWKAGIADYVVIMRNKTYLIVLLIIGYLIIAALAIFIIRRKNKNQSKSSNL
ncbi:MAG: serine hydrolase [Flavobacteriaceae bacterium]|nr:serine hydrolase [Flavobacteriaceae bacterium]